MSFIILSILTVTTTSAVMFFFCWSYTCYHEKPNETFEERSIKSIRSMLVVYEIITSVRRMGGWKYFLTFWYIWGSTGGFVFTFISTYVWRVLEQII